MALPHMPSYYTARKNIYEATIVNRRVKETDFRDKWTDTAKYFQTNDVAAAKKKVWESDESFQNSMDAYKSSRDKEAQQQNLQRRKSRLAHLLKEERDQYHVELRHISKDYLLDDMRGRCESLKSAREEKRKQIADAKMYEHWKQNNPDLRRMEGMLHQQHVVEGWSEQVEEQKEKEEQERMEREEAERKMEAARQSALQAQREQDEDKLQQEKVLKHVLKNQMHELKEREAEAGRLKQQEAELMKEKWELAQVEQQRKQMETGRKKMEFGRVLLRQHAAALRRRSKQVQDELVEDMKFLGQLVKQEEQEREVQTARQQEARADASWMRRVLQDQLKVEKAREAELDMLYQDEASRVWQKREDEWQKERAARERLMKEVMETRQDQIDTNMEAVRQRQEQSVERREQLLQELEIANQLTQREQEHDEVAKTERKQQLEAQMTARREGQKEANERQVRELAEEKQAEDDYDQMLALEAERLNLKGYQPQKFVRKQAWS